MGMDAGRFSAVAAVFVHRVGFLIPHAAPIIFFVLSFALFLSLIRFLNFCGSVAFLLKLIY